MFALGCLGAATFVGFKYARLVPGSSGVEPGIGRRVLSTGPSLYTRTPKDCDIVSGAHRILQPTERDEYNARWIPTQFSFCQLPAAWREAFGAARVGEEIVYSIPKELVPLRISALLGAKSDEDLRIAFRIERINTAPDGLVFPENITSLQDAKELPSGVKYLIKSRRPKGTELTETGAAAIHYSFWSQDGTLIGSSYLSPTPAVLTVAKTAGYARALLNAVHGEGDEIVALLPSAVAKTDQPVVLRATVEKVFR